ncbi:MAG: hypothetical protein U1D26_01780, partial [Patescibacteria group bacterium]|nr:hypothetical protein [Patescibacteria group bacterium]
MENLEDKKEQPRERLSVDESLDEANMVRALLTDWKGWLHDGHRTKAQYEAAHEAVLEMRKAAEQETDEKKFLYQAARILHNVARVPLGIIAGLDEAL